MIKVSRSRLRKAASNQISRVKCVLDRAEWWHWNHLRGTPRGPPEEWPADDSFQLGDLTAVIIPDDEFVQRDMRFRRHSIAWFAPEITWERAKIERMNDISPSNKKIEFGDGFHH